MKIVLRTKQLFEQFKHPMLFPQQVILTDGSICEMYSLSNKKPIVKLISDSQNHPTWNPKLTDNQAILYKQEQVMKFQSKFGDLKDMNQFSQCIDTSSLKTTPNTDNIPVLEDSSKQQSTEPEWMKYKRAAEEKAKLTAPKKTTKKK